MTTTAPATDQLRQPHPIAPVSIRIEHLVYHPGLGLGTLDIVTADGQHTDAYILAVNRDAGRLVSVKLTKLVSGAIYTIDLTARPWRCDCGDATKRPQRPGGCKHIVALRLAAAKLRAASEESSTA